jgi:hypothetical protein
MKINEISIIMEPNELEIQQGKAAVGLYRNKDKIWNVIENGSIRGLFPYEVKLANMIQEDIIQKFNRVSK